MLVVFNYAYIIGGVYYELTMSFISTIDLSWS